MAFQRELHNNSEQLEDGEDEAAGGAPDLETPYQALASPQADSRKSFCTSSFSKAPVCLVTSAVTVK